MSYNVTILIATVPAQAYCGPIASPIADSEYHEAIIYYYRG